MSRPKGGRGAEPVALPGSPSQRDCGLNEAIVFQALARLAQDLETDAVPPEMAATMPTGKRPGRRPHNRTCSLAARMLSL